MLSQCVQSFSSHCWGAFSCVFDACVWGGWTKAMCLVRPHTSGASLYKSCENQTIKCTKCALWVTDLPHLHHRHLAYLSKSLVTAPVSLGLCEINFQKNKRKNEKNQFDFSQQLARHRLNLWHLSARTASFTMQTFSISETTVCNQCAL